MSDKSGLCMWCGRWTESRAEDGLADCDRPDCIAQRDYSDEPGLKPKKMDRLKRRKAPVPIDPTKTVTVSDLLELAMWLKSPDGENPEYDRALVELVTDAAGLSMDDKDVIGQAIGVKQRFT